jgi:CheY-like chemotaxis protein
MELRVKKILVFDDEEAIRMLYELELSEPGYGHTVHEVT